jgi:hypothetical protein
MTITLDNKSYPVKATMRAWRKFEKETGVKVVEVDASDITLIPELIYYFVVDGCLAQKMEFSMEVEEWLGLITVQDLPQLIKVMEEAMGSTTGDGKKKKVEEIP